MISILVGKELKNDIPERMEIKSKPVFEFEVSFLGESGSFSSQVARRAFGERAELLPPPNLSRNIRKSGAGRNYSRVDTHRKYYHRCPS